MSGGDALSRLRSEAEEAEKALQALGEKREMYKSMLSRLDTEEHAVSQQLQNTRAKFRGFVGLGLADPSLYTDTAAAPAPKTPEKTIGVIHNEAEWDYLVEALPSSIRIEPAVIGSEIHKLAGPDTEDTHILEKNIAARTISTYPLTNGRTKRQGSPICDQFYVEAMTNRVFVCVADGCNWGTKPKEAARRASQGFVKHLRQHQNGARTLHDIGKVLIDAFVCAHNDIVAGITDTWEAGTTTLIGGVIFPLTDDSAKTASRKEASTTTTTTTSSTDDKTEEKKKDYGVVLLSIGDCKCFLWEACTGRVHDVTAGNRGNLMDATDPGGRIGPYLTGGLPDTRNLSLFYETVQQDDILLFCSDGVHDNFDPSSLGVDPKELTPAFDGKNWDEACKLDEELAAQVKQKFAADRLALLIGRQSEKIQSLFPEGLEDFSLSPGNNSLTPSKSDDSPNSPVTSPTSPPTSSPTISSSLPSSASSVQVPPTLSSHRYKHNPVPEVICRDVTEYCRRVTMSSRDYMENNPKGKLPKDFKLYPGKMDHTTCVAIKVSFPFSFTTPATQQ